MEQLVANIIFSASNIFLVGISFSIIFSTAKFFHFAHAIVITAAPYVTFSLASWLGAPILVSVIVSLAACTVMGWSTEFFVYRTMRRNGASPLVLLLASLGLYIILQNVISGIFGDDTKLIDSSNVRLATSILGARMTNVQLAMVGTAVLVLLAKIILVDKTRIGLALRSIADSPDLAEVSGVDFEKSILLAFCLGSLIAGATGILWAFDVGMTPTMGLPMLLLGVVAVVVGGSGRTPGILMASFLLSSFQQVAGWNLGTHWEEAAAFMLLIAFMLFRPQGILGKPLRKSTT